jgi:two-component system, OmpR family, sensor histidine kinase KdpD
VRFVRALASSATRERLPQRWPEWLAWLGLLVAITTLMRFFRDQLNQAHVTLAYLLIVQGGSARGGRPLGLTLAGAAFLCFNFFFLPPFGTLVVQNSLDWLVLIAFLGSSVLSAHLLYRARAEAAMARRRAEEIDRLAALGAETVNAGRAEDSIMSIVGVIRSSLGVDDCAVYTVEQERGVRRLASRSSSTSDNSLPDDRLIDWVGAQGRSAGEWADGTTRVDLALETLAERTIAGPLRVYLRPLQVRGEIIGVIRLSKESGILLTSAQVRVLEALAYYAALAAERVLLASEAERATALQEAHRAKDAVLASVSHDLRTPLTTIKGLAHEIATTGDERAAIIEEEADRLTRFVSQLLDLSRINSGVAVSNIQPNEAEDLLGAAAQRVSARLRDHELRITVSKDDPLLLGLFDFSETLRALVNLIENAAKYSLPGEPIDLNARRDGDWLIFSVADRGTGVAIGDRDRIFEPFYRGPDAVPDAGGAGLGLPIARGIVEAQGGQLRVEDRDGGGSVFSLLVPATNESDVAAESS